jgi:TATA-box binding protein (TBP) (component of TFIID and TFIIIB)
MKLSIKKKKKKKIQTTRKNSFQNQCTFLVDLPNGKIVNQKVFKNGNIQMTGLKSEVDGLAAIQILIDNITKNNNAFENPIVLDPDIITKTDCNIVLINSDYSCGFKIKRDKLYEILGTYGLYVSYEPDIYPGVNAKFYWNKIYNNTIKPGICNCTVSCDGKGTGDGNGQCKKVTISTFQSGNVIITGARNQQQTNDAYSFINKIFKQYYADIYRNSKDVKETGSLQNGIYTFYINRSSIQNIDIYNMVLSKLTKNKKIGFEPKYSSVFKTIDTHKSANLLKPVSEIKMDQLW